MVEDSGASARPDDIRVINEPEPIEIEANDGKPVAIIDRGERYPVHAVTDAWTIVDEWWRSLISRQYFRLTLGDGRTRTVFRDRVTGTWFEQRY